MGWKQPLQEAIIFHLLMYSLLSYITFKYRKIYTYTIIYAFNKTERG